MFCVVIAITTASWGDVFRMLPNIKMDRFAKIVNNENDYFHKVLDLRCLKGFLILH